MRKLILLIAALFLITSSASWGAAGLVRSEASEKGQRLALTGERGAAAVHLPAVLPRADAEHAETYGFRTSAALARMLGAGTGTDSATSTASGGASATVVVTATVLPVRTIVVERGTVTQIWSNTEDRHARNSLYVVREGGVEGGAIPLTADVWTQARALLARSNDATGRVA